MAASSISRRISEFVGVALFAMALIWLISLVTYEPSDPVWFFTTGVAHPSATVTTEEESPIEAVNPSPA